jgi:outer membrane protein assembly factor BamB
MYEFAQFAKLALFPIILSQLGTPNPAAEGDPIVFGATDWPWWRGPDRNGIAAADQKPPTRWSATGNVVWKAEVPGRGHGSATVIGEHVYLAAAEPDQQVQSVLCFDRKTGKRLWQTEVHKGGFDTKGNAKTSQASSTPACDSSRVFVNFLNGGAIWTTALDRDGKQLWQTRVSDFVTHQGFGSSPAIYKALVLVSADHKGGGAIAGLDRATGKVVWSADRPKVPNYASPIVLTIGGRDQLIMTGCKLVTSFDPLNGKKLWETNGSTEECVTSVVTDGTCVFTSGGYPKNHVSAVMADGTGKVAWENITRVYVPSLLVHDGYLYGIQDTGMATCWKCDTGKQVWTGRLGGTFSSSPILVGDRIYATNEAGKTLVFKASPTKFDLESENQLGDEVFATPTICGGHMYTRVAITKDGKRQEWLYCLGTK